MLTKKPEKWKKHSVSIFVLATPSAKLIHVCLSFSQVTSVEKREPRKHFSASASKTFFSVPFFLLRLLGKNSNQTWISFASDVARTNIETEYFFHFSGFFVSIPNPFYLWFFQNTIRKLRKIKNIWIKSHQRIDIITIYGIKMLL